MKRVAHIEVVVDTETENGACDAISQLLNEAWLDWHYISDGPWEEAAGQ